MRMRKRSQSRRRFLALAGAATTGLVAYASVRRWQDTASIRHFVGPADNSKFDQGVLRTLVVFLGTYFGMPLSDTDDAELLQRLTVAARVDSNWRLEYQVFASIVDELTQQDYGVGFSVADEPQRAAIVDKVKNGDKRWRRRRIQAFFALEDTSAIRMQSSTLPHLLRLFRLSGVPWRRRGYASWPGTGGEMLAYTQEMVPLKC